MATITLLEPGTAVPKYLLHIAYKINKIEKIIANRPIKIPKNNGPVEQLVIPLINSAIGPESRSPEKIEENLLFDTPFFTKKKTKLTKFEKKFFLDDDWSLVQKK